MTSDLLQSENNLQVSSSIFSIMESELTSKHKEGAIFYSTKCDRRIETKLGINENR